MKPLFFLQLKFRQLMNARKWRQAYVLLDQIELMGKTCSN